VVAQKPLDVALYWFDGSWSGPCLVGTGPTAYNTCSIPLTVSAVAPSLLDGGEEVDRIEIWGVKIANVTACDVQPLLEVVNKTIPTPPPSADVTNAPGGSTQFKCASPPQITRSLETCR